MKCIWQLAFRFVVCSVMYSILRTTLHVYHSNLVNLKVHRTFIVPLVSYAMNYRPKNSFSMSYASHKVIFPCVEYYTIQSEQDHYAEML